MPYDRELAATVEGFALADGVDLVATVTEHRLDWLRESGTRAWVAVEGR